MKKLGTALALSSLLATGVAMAQDAPFTTFDINLEPVAHLSTTQLPEVSQQPTKGTVAFRIINNTGKAVYFVHGDQKVYIPVVSRHTVTAPISDDAYKAVDEEGNVVSQWNLPYTVTQKELISSASAEQYQQWGQTLQQLIANQKVVGYNYTQKYEPAYTQPASQGSEKNTSVRGFW